MTKESYIVILSIHSLVLIGGNCSNSFSCCGITNFCKAGFKLSHYTNIDIMN
jgi:hypothetical protein